ncbi:MAG TPA: hypothetical protein VNH83_13375 [Bryobacteraceae bacterium]|nr:hypothetical protein [Bryobacteraceae bacterium]
MDNDVPLRILVEVAVYYALSFVGIAVLLVSYASQTSACLGGVLLLFGVVGLVLRKKRGS